MGKAKFVFIAANAWDSTQQSWLQTQLADPTTYTFVIAPRVDDVVGRAGRRAGVGEHRDGASYTLELLGHTHEYRHEDTQHVISGNAGAPLRVGRQLRPAPRRAAGERQHHGQRDRRVDGQRDRHLDREPDRPEEIAL